MSIEVAVIPSAGSGTRMRPATRAVPKPLLPVIDRPVIQYVVEEAVTAGASEIVLVVDERPGDPVMAHFTAGSGLPGLEGVRFTRVVQPEPLGLGHAVLCAAEAVANRPFITLLSDMFPRPGRSFAPRLTGLFEDRPVVAVREVPPEFFDRYGIVSPAGPIAGGVVPISGAVEKPGAAAASNLGLVGRYVFTPDIFEVLGSQTAGHGGEIQLTDAINSLALSRGATALVVGDDLFDTGMPAGLLEATAAMGLDRPDLADDFRTALEGLLE